MGACADQFFFFSFVLTPRGTDGWNHMQAALEAGGRISKVQALALASTNLEQLLGCDPGGASGTSDLVATRGGDLLSLESKVVGIISPRRGSVDLF
jgi:hypothetical protein